jgi:hypothetical protein
MILRVFISRIGEPQTTDRQEATDKELYCMRFYYWSFLNWIPLTIFYVIAAVLVLILWKLTKGDRGAPKLVWSFIVVMVVLPWTEELWIAWNFGKLCKKDAGIFVYKTVAVDGFYDATRPTSATPWSKKSGKELDGRGYKFYEMPVPDFKGGPAKIAHLEKENSTWTTTLLDQPTARYHYVWPNRNRQVGHKIWRSSEAIVDTQTNEELAGAVRYGRQAPWFFVGLDRPGMGCPRPGEDPLKRSGLLYTHVLLPKDAR